MPNAIAISSDAGNAWILWIFVAVANAKLLLLKTQVKNALLQLEVTKNIRKNKSFNFGYIC